MARLKTSERKDLPDSAFAYIDAKGRRRLPINDEPHVRNALARFERVAFESDEARERARLRLLKAAKRYGIVPVGFITGQIRSERAPRPADRKALPTGSVTFLMTDIEGSTELLRRLGRRYPSVLSETRKVLRRAVRSSGGYEVDAHADEYFASFERASDALDAALAIQRMLGEHTWPDGVDVRVRAGIHGGRPTMTDTGYVGISVHTVARICSAGHGGQILVSEQTKRAVKVHARGRPSPEPRSASIGRAPEGRVLVPGGGEGPPGRLPATSDRRLGVTRHSAGSRRQRRRLRRDASARETPSCMERPEVRFARAADGAYLAYQVLGEGPTVLFWQEDSVRPGRRAVGLAAGARVARGAGGVRARDHLRPTRHRPVQPQRRAGEPGGPGPGHADRARRRRRSSEPVSAGSWSHARRTCCSPPRSPTGCRRSCGRCRARARARSPATRGARTRRTWRPSEPCSSGGGRRAGRGTTSRSTPTCWAAPGARRATSASSRASAGGPARPTWRSSSHGSGWRRTSATSCRPYRRRCSRSTSALESQRELAAYIAARAPRTESVLPARRHDGGRALRGDARRDPAVRRRGACAGRSGLGARHRPVHRHRGLDRARGIGR